MIGKIILAVVVGIIVWLACEFLGGILASAVPTPSWVYSIGKFLEDFGSLLGLLAALWYYFKGGHVV